MSIKKKLMLTSICLISLFAFLFSSCGKGGSGKSKLEKLAASDVYITFSRVEKMYDSDFQYNSSRYFITYGEQDSYEWLCKVKMENGHFSVFDINGYLIADYVYQAVDDDHFQLSYEGAGFGETGTILYSDSKWAIVRLEGMNFDKWPYYLVGDYSSMYDNENIEYYSYMRYEEYKTSSMPLVTDPKLVSALDEIFGN